MKNIKLGLLVGLLLSVPASFVGGSSASAAVTLVGSDSTAVVRFCKDSIKPAIANSVCTSSNANKALRTASESSSCASFKDKTNTGGARFRQCMVENAKGYFTDAYSPVPSNAQDYDAAFSSVLAGVTKPSAGGSGSGSGGGTQPAADCSDITQGCDLVGKYLNPLINLLTGLLGLVAVISLIIGGIQYTTSSGDPQKVTDAKKRISSTIIALVSLFLLYGFLQFLVPGGIF